MNERNEHRITGIDIPFSDMVIFMVKAALASIPAALILAVLAGMVALVIAAMGAAG